MAHFFFEPRFYVRLFYELNGENKVRQRKKSKESDASIFRIVSFKVGHSKKKNVSLRVRLREYNF